MLANCLPILPALRCLQTADMLAPDSDVKSLFTCDPSTTVTTFIHMRKVIT